MPDCSIELPQIIIILFILIVIFLFDALILPLVILFFDYKLIHQILFAVVEELC